MLDGILPILERSGVRVVTYADEVVILVSGIFPTVMSEIIIKFNQKGADVIYRQDKSTRIAPPAVKWIKIGR